MTGTAEKSTREIKLLLQKLDPNQSGSHQDRIKALDRFKKYVIGGASSRARNAKATTPEFYDDDITFLYLGSKIVGSDDEIDEDDDLAQYRDGRYYGLLQACGTPSTDHTGGLKRSAKAAMMLLKFLACDFSELKDGKVVKPKANPFENDGNDDLNPFAQQLCTLTVDQLQYMKLDVHIKNAQYNTAEANKRSGAKDEACNVALLLLTQHMNVHGTAPEPISAKDLLPSTQARHGLEVWLQEHTPPDIQAKVIPLLQSPLDTNSATAESSTTAASKTKPVENTIHEGDKRLKNPFDDDDDEDEEDNPEPVVTTANRKTRAPSAETSEDESDDQNPGFGPTRWADSNLAIQLATLGSTTDRINFLRNDASLDVKSQQRVSRQKRDVERDPLGIRNADDFDLRRIQQKKKELLEEAIHDLEEEIETLGDQFEHHAKHEEIEISEQVADQMMNLEMQLEHLDSILRGKHRRRQQSKETKASDTSTEKKSEEGDAETKAEEMTVNPYPIENLSIIPSDPNFDPLLFLTLIHRNASLDQLRNSLYYLKEKRDENAQQAQTIVRDKIDLFIQCANGINLFADNSNSKKSTSTIKERIESLETHASLCSDIALQGFQSLLENTKEVQKVQAARSVLNRIGPLLQIPNSMKQDIENGRFSAAIKTFRQSLLIDENDAIDLLRQVKRKATVAIQEARRQLEYRIADPNLPLNSLLDSVKDLEELVSLKISSDVVLSKKSGNIDEIEGSLPVVINANSSGKFLVGSTTIDVRGSNSPSISCLLLQAASFSNLVKTIISQVEENITRIYAGESFSAVTGHERPRDYFNSSPSDTSEQPPDIASISNINKTARNRLQDSIVDIRVMATMKAVSIARTWFPRLMEVAILARQFEMRRNALLAQKHAHDHSEVERLSCFELFLTNVCPSIDVLVDQVTFMTLGMVEVTTGSDLNLNNHLPSVLRMPLPPAQSSKCASEVVHLVEVIERIMTSSMKLRDRALSSTGRMSSQLERVDLESSALGDCLKKSRSTLIDIERRHCRYIFEECTRHCSIQASGNGFIDDDAILATLARLSKELTLPEECSTEIFDGCKEVIDICCNGLSDYVETRDDNALLRAVSSCASMLHTKVASICREVTYLANESPGAFEKILSLEKYLMDTIRRRESEMFEAFLDHIRQSISYFTKLSPQDVLLHDSGNKGTTYNKVEASFPPYLASCLFALVRCRAQVEKAFGSSTARRDFGSTYQYISMNTAADCVVLGLCDELRSRIPRMLGIHADKFSNELQFLINTLKKILSEKVVIEAENCRRILLSKAGGDFQGNGPDGLGEIEKLERLGRVYVLCLSGNGDV